MSRRSTISNLILLACLTVIPVAAVAEQKPLAEEIGPLLECLSGCRDTFSIDANIEIPIDDRMQAVRARFVRYDEQQFDLEVRHSDYAIRIRRRDESTEMALPLHEKVFVGTGVVHAKDNLQPRGACDRLVSSGSLVSTYLSMLRPENQAALASVLQGLWGLEYSRESDRWVGSKGRSLRFSDGGNGIEIKDGQTQIKLQIAAAPKSPEMLLPAASGRVELSREELERQLARGLRRGLEIAAPSPLLTSPPRRGKSVPHGELRWVGGQRLVLLSGTPEQIGRAHGELLRDEAIRCIDSVLYAFGTVETIRTGDWFRFELEEAYQRLASHIPNDHKRETKALATALALNEQTLQTINVFPELFHCSGFAVFGKATAEGKLYHGRVLDYMTTIGLQDAAANFVVAVDGKIPFANVGYAGFIGSVTGMNARSVSLGEMGGGGEGQWDGVPMATLMRRALEECSTLAEVKTLWRQSPRTCEYYYVFADGNTNEAVGVAAVPESIEFIEPGQADPRLGEGIEDAVVLSAGDRLETLRERVLSRHGQIDADLGKWLMSRPVAMESNLHNALFVPADKVFFVANADHTRPAAECEYQRYDLNRLLESMPLASPVAVIAK